jgi:hypothetical protein
MGDDSVEQFWYIVWLIKASLIILLRSRHPNLHIGSRPYPLEACKAAFVQTVDRAFAWRTAIL